MQLFAPLKTEPQPELQRIEVASSFQLPGFHIVGLPSPEVMEARERIRAAMENSGFELPKRRVILNLSPASIRKRGTGLDLAMALAILDLDLGGTSQELVAAWGEVGLDGSIKAAGQITRSVYAAWQSQVSRLLVSEEEYDSALRATHWIRKAEFFHSPAPILIPVSSLREAYERLVDPDSHENHERTFIEDDRVSEAGELLLPLPPSLERALCAGALGGHHILLLGPKGTGKSHALEWLISLQPETSFRMKVNHLLLLELAQSRGMIDFSTPVRRVSSSVRAPALIGSASTGQVRPGEFSLAHGGILIADEFPEWSRDAREALREPLERGVVTLTRAKSSIEFPARFSFAANGNLCPCGGWPSEFPIPLEAERQPIRVPKCRCTHSQRSHYISRMSGPILDRMDLVLLVNSTPPQGAGNPTLRIRLLKEQITLARNHAMDLWGAPPGLLAPSMLEHLLDAHPLWRETLDQLQLTSLRARHKVIRVALSLCLWDGMREPQPAHLIEASCYRPERFGLCA